MKNIKTMKVFTIIFEVISFVGVAYLLGYGILTCLEKFDLMVAIAYGAGAIVAIFVGILLAILRKACDEVMELSERISVVENRMWIDHDNKYSEEDLERVADDASDYRHQKTEVIFVPDLKNASSGKGNKGAAPVYEHQKTETFYVPEATNKDDNKKEYVHQKTEIIYVPESKKEEYVHQKTDIIFVPEDKNAPKKESASKKETVESKAPTIKLDETNAIIYNSNIYINRKPCKLNLLSDISQADKKVLFTLDNQPYEVLFANQERAKMFYEELASWKRISDKK